MRMRRVKLRMRRVKMRALKHCTELYIACANNIMNYLTLKLGSTFRDHV